MLTITTRELLRAEREALAAKGSRIALVPTMGYLHEGHLSLVRLAARHADRVIATVFVNPTQFNDPKDLERYPRDLERDLTLLDSAGCHAVFAPDESQIYGSGFQTWIHPGALAEPHEGAHRPGHFRGVATVVAILLNLARPDAAIFGEKDFQQLRIIERLVDDLKIDTRIVRGPIVREPDGLAMSSRNVRLSAVERKQALAISATLREIERRYREGERQAAGLCERGCKQMESAGLKVDYLCIVNQDTLAPVREVTSGDRVLAAAYSGEIRLIDNIELG